MWTDIDGVASWLDSSGYKNMSARGPCWQAGLWDETAKLETTDGSMDGTKRQDVESCWPKVHEDSWEQIRSSNMFLDVLRRIIPSFNVPVWSGTQPWTTCHRPMVTGYHVAPPPQFEDVMTGWFINPFHSTSDVSTTKLVSLYAN